jgi:hypothetical protein
MTLFDIAPEAVAWQRKVREQRMREEPRLQGRSLDGYTVETIGQVQAAGLIGKYEWLGTMGRATYCIGLFSTCRELEGVACFGYGPQGTIRNIICPQIQPKTGIGPPQPPSPALCLERGACVHWAPPNAASFLITHACKLVYQITGTAIFFAYGDPMAGEYGAVYQAANWAYLGQGLWGEEERVLRTMVLPPGKDPDNPAHWQTTRILRRQKPRLYMSNCEDFGWRLSKRSAKHVYAINVGRYRKKWLNGLVTRAYPAPRPSLKMKAA